jgi:hypothetical protein
MELRKLRTIRRHQRRENAIEERQNSPRLQAMYEMFLPVRSARRYTPKFVTDIFGCRVPNDENARTRENEAYKKLEALVAAAKESIKKEKEDNEEE